MNEAIRNVTAILLLATTVRLAAAQQAGLVSSDAPAMDNSSAAELAAPRRLYLPDETSSTAPPAPAFPQTDENGSGTPPALAPLPSAPASAQAGYAARPMNFRQRCHYFMQSVFWGFPSQFERPPLGRFLKEHGETEVANGTAARMVLYQYDFVDGSNTLNLRGRDRLARIAALLPRNFFPIVIERTPALPALAEARRLTVLRELASGPFPIPAERVVVGRSRGDDLRGVEAELINRNIMLQTRARGIGTVKGGSSMSSGNQRGGGGGMGGGGMGGGGMGGGGMGGMGGGGMGGMGGGFGR